MAFPIKKRLDLNDLGVEWAGCYIDYAGLTFKESRSFSANQFDEANPESDKNIEFVLELLTSHFLAGKGYNGSAVVDLKATDLEELPVDVITRSVETLVGGPKESFTTT